MVQVVTQLQTFNCTPLLIELFPLFKLRRINEDAYIMRLRSPRNFSNFRKYLSNATSQANSSIQFNHRGPFFTTIP